MAVLAHLGGAFFSIFVPLVIYLVKERDPFLRHHAAQAVNFQLTLVIGWFVAFILLFVIIGFILIPILLVLDFVLAILASVAASRGEYYRYPLTINLLK